MTKEDIGTLDHIQALSAALQDLVAPNVKPVDCSKFWNSSGEVGRLNMLKNLTDAYYYAKVESLSEGN